MVSNEKFLNVHQLLMFAIRYCLSYDEYFSVNVSVTGHCRDTERPYSK